MLVKLNHKTAINLKATPFISVSQARDATPEVLTPSQVVSITATSSGAAQQLKAKPFLLNTGTGGPPIPVTRDESLKLREAIDEYGRDGKYHWLYDGLALNLNVVNAVHAMGQALFIGYPGGMQKLEPVPNGADLVSGYVKAMERFEKRSAITSELGGPFAAAAPPPPPPTEEEKKFRELLAAHTTDMVEEARQKRLDPVAGREAEIGRVITILGHKFKNNPGLIGDAGTGKTSIVEGLAQKIAAGAESLPPHLKGKKLHAINLSRMDSTQYKGEIEGKIFPILDGAIAAEKRGEGGYIFFIDESHAQMRAGATSSTPPVAELLKPYLTSPHLQFITATTIEEHRKFIEPNKALDRRFSPVLVAEPTREQVLEMLEVKRAALEHHNALSIPPALLPYIYDLSQEMLPNRKQPDKSISILDDVPAIAKEKKDKAAGIRHVHIAFEYANGLKPGFLSEDQTEKYRQLETRLLHAVQGQDDQVRAIARTVKSGRAGLSGGGRPIASLLLTGNARGLGRKTAGYALAEHLAGGRENAVYIDLANFSKDPYAAQRRLLGTAAIRADDREEGELTGAVTRKPYAVVILDNIDKAHPDVQDLVARISAKGEIRDAMGRRVSFRNAILLATSASFQGISGDLRQSFRDIKFTTPSKEVCEKILRRAVGDLSGRVEKQYGLAVEAAPVLLQQMANANARGQKGARELLVQFERDIAEPLGGWLIDNLTLKDNFGGAARDKGELLPVLTVTGSGERFAVDAPFTPGEGPDQGSKVIRLGAARPKKGNIRAI